jgi:uncharacterized damage-inducible protein DinB
LHTVEPLSPYEPVIGRWLWSLEETRRETREALNGLAPAYLTWIPAPRENSIGTLLYHIALIELDWLFTEVLESRPWPQEIKELFPSADRDEQGCLSVEQDATLEAALHRLDCVRKHLLLAFRDMSLQDFRRPRAFPEYQVTPEWVLHHLIQHEAEHRGHIQLLRSLAEQLAETP